MNLTICFSISVMYGYILLSRMISLYNKWITFSFQFSAHVYTQLHIYIYTYSVIRSIYQNFVPCYNLITKKNFFFFLSVSQLQHLDEPFWSLNIKVIPIILPSLIAYCKVLKFWFGLNICSKRNKKQIPVTSVLHSMYLKAASLPSLGLHLAEPTTKPQLLEAQGAYISPYTSFI